MTAVVNTPVGDSLRAGSTLLRLHMPEEEPHLDHLWPLLGAEERDRARRFARCDDAARYIVGHARLRQWLGRHLRVAPQALRFAANRHGKPMLDGLPCSPCFNLSHSGSWVLIAIDESGPVGVDVETIRPNMAQIDDFRAVLSPEEQHWLDRLPAAERAQAFARTWVRKEAYVKAIGEGMSRDLRSISIIDGSDGSPSLLYDDNAEPTCGDWRLVDLTIDESHAACMAYRGDV
jgi:4'-phosphopantetheinyl transferase